MRSAESLQQATTMPVSAVVDPQRSRSVEDVAPFHHEVSLFLEGSTGVALASPVDAVVIVDACATFGHVSLPGTFFLRCRPTDKAIRHKEDVWLFAKYLLLLDKEAPVGRLISTALSSVLEGGLVGGPVEAFAVGRSKAFLVSVDTEVVDSVRVLEEFLVGWVLLDITPSATLPAARHEV